MKNHLILISIMLLLCSCQEESKTCDNTKVFTYLNNYVSDSIVKKYSDTIDFISTENFLADFDSLPKEYAELIINDFIKPNISKEFNYLCQFDSIKYLYGQKKNTRLDPMNTCSDSTYFFMIAGFEDSISIGGGIAIDFEQNKLVQWWHPFEDSLKYIKMDSSQIDAEINYSQIKLATTRPICNTGFSGSLKVR